MSSLRTRQVVGLGVCGFVIASTLVLLDIVSGGGWNFFVLSMTIAAVGAGVLVVGAVIVPLGAQLWAAARRAIKRRPSRSHRS